jgi:hypothetical protein
MQVRIMVPSQPQRQAPQPSSSPFGDTMYEVVVPQGVRPGQPFALIANGQRVMVTCPARAQPGQKIQFRLPIQVNKYIYINVYLLLMLSFLQMFKCFLFFLFNV